MRGLPLFVLAFFLTSEAYADPLHDAAGEGDVDRVKQLLAEGADVNMSDPLVGSALAKATLAGQAEAVSALLAAGADVNLAGGMMRLPPLQLAAGAGRSEIVPLLLAAGADVTAMDVDGNTPLHKAADSGATDVVEMLLDAGADIDARNAKGYPPIVFAGAAEHFDVVDLLVARGAFSSEPVAPISALLAASDPEHGRELLEAAGCNVCHGAGGHAPGLWGVVGREKATWPEFGLYTEALKRVGGTWTYEELNAFLASPTRFAPGNRMSMPIQPVPEISDPADRADIIAYLRLQSDEPLPLPE